MVTLTGALARASAVHSPPKPEPITTTRCRAPAGAGGAGDAAGEEVSTAMVPPLHSVDACLNASCQRQPELATVSGAELPPRSQRMAVHRRSADASLSDPSDTWAMSLSSFPRYPLLFGPSPVHPLEPLTVHLGGAQLWAKREDCNSGIA